MHIVSVVTLLVGSIFAYTLAAPQFGGGLAPVNINALSAALAQLAQQLAAQRNTTITVGNSSTIVSGVSSSVANAHIDANQGNPGHGHPGHGHGNGWGNNGWGNNGWGYWRGVPEEEYKEGDDLADEYQPGDEDIDSKEEEHLKF